jgi:hypothetical protein
MIGKEQKEAAKTLVMIGFNVLILPDFDGLTSLYVTHNFNQAILTSTVSNPYHTATVVDVTDFLEKHMNLLGNFASFQSQFQSWYDQQKAFDLEFSERIPYRIWRPCPKVNYLS